MHFILLLFIIIQNILSILSIPNADLQMMYASPNGSTSSNCGTQADPCRSFQLAFDHASESSVKVLVSSGTYIQRCVINIGSKSAHFTYNDVEYPIYSTVNSKSNEAVFNVASGSLTVDGILFLISQSSAVSILKIQSNENNGSASFNHVSILAGNNSIHNYSASLFIVDGGQFELTDFSASYISFSSSNIIQIQTSVCNSYYFVFIFIIQFLQTFYFTSLFSFLFLLMISFSF